MGIHGRRERLPEALSLATCRHGRNRHPGEPVWRAVLGPGRMGAFKGAEDRCPPGEPSRRYPGEIFLDGDRCHSQLGLAGV